MGFLEKFSPDFKNCIPLPIAPFLKRLELFCSKRYDVLLAKNSAAEITTGKCKKDANWRL